MGIGLGGDAVARAKNDDPLGRRRAERDKKGHQQQDGMFAQPELHESIILTKRRFDLYGLNHCNVKVGDAEHLEFPDNFFDYVYSNGVIHHTPNTQKAVEEIYRVLRPGAKAVVMIYNRDSIFYWWHLMILGQARYALLKIMPFFLLRYIFRHNERVVKLKLALQAVKWRDLPDLVLRFSDGHFNPYTKVYSLGEARSLFHQFSNVRIELYSSCKHCIEHILLVEKLFGWGLFIFATK